MSMPSAKRIAQRAVKDAATALDAVRRPPAGVVVLIYHRVGGASGLDVDLPEGLFDQQMAVLAASGRVVSLGTALDLVEGPPPPGLAGPW